MDFLRERRFLHKMGLSRSKQEAADMRNIGKRDPKAQNVSRYISSPKPQIFIALFDYDARGTSDISIRKGDLMEVPPQREIQDWLMVKILSTKKRGLVPESFVVKKDSILANDWFFAGTSRIEAEEMVLMDSNEIGTFLVRPSERVPNCYSLTIKDCSNTGTYHVTNLRIKRDTRGGFYITPKIVYKSLPALIADNQRRHVTCRLTTPCPKPVPQLFDLAPDLQDAWEIPRSQIHLIEQIGAGQFGEVYRGKWQKTIDVAVKTLKPGTMSCEAFLEEATIMKKFRHNKLVALYAVCSREEPIYIVTEYMSHGSLLAYLRTMGPQELKLGHLLYIMSQVASGMAFLESKNLVHRDLAARNILIGENHCAKVADFGLARVFSDDNKLDRSSQPNLLPVKWTAPEAFRYSMFSTKSDVWSFGIVLMETFTYGEKPYPNMTSKEVAQKVKEGYRMPKPRHHNVPDQVYEKMRECWRENPQERPTFEYLAYFFENYIDASQEIYE